MRFPGSNRSIKPVAQDVDAEAVTDAQKTFLDELRGSFARELGTLSGELDRVGTLVLDATTGLSDAFQQLKAATQDQGGLLETLLASMDRREGGPGNADSGAGPGAVAAAADALRLLTTLLRDISDNSQKGLTKTVDMTGQMSATLKLLSGIDTIVKQTHVLSINATIEARRVGAVGRGFEVVAKEVRELAGYSKDLAHNIADQIARTQDALRAVVGSLESVSDAGARAARAAGGPAATALTEMNGLRASMRAGVERLEQVNRDIARAIADSVRCLQFGDIVTQLVGTMKARVERLANACRALDALCAGDTAGSFPHALAGLRAAFADEVATPVSAHSMGQGDVELF